MTLPIYLDDEILRYLRERAEVKCVSLSELVNELLNRAIVALIGVVEDRR